MSSYILVIPKKNTYFPTEIRTKLSAFKSTLFQLIVLISQTAEGKEVHCKRMLKC